VLIKEISITNFRGIREGKLSDLTQVNILVGRNNTGKSTVLEALTLMGQIAAHKAGMRSFTEDALGRQMPEHLYDRRVARGSRNPKELHFGFKESNKIEIAMLFLDGTTLQLKTCLASMLTSHLAGSLDLAASDHKALMWLSRAVLVDAFLAREFDKVEQHLWPEILADRSDRELNEAVADTYDTQIEDLSFVPFNGSYKLVFKTRLRAIPVDSVGDGMRHALAVLSVAVVAKDSALMVEELETHQHPESLQKLLLALFKMAKRNSIQLFMSTHSLELIAYALEAAEKEALDLKLFHLSLSPDGLLNARGIPAPDAKLLMDLGHDLRMQYKFVRS
jgi:energy-coupling factor transporter ATP-binding protein EcfA2